MRRRSNAHLPAQPRPVVVIGEPGSGKTGLCVILTLDLLDEASRHRVPVLLDVSSWNPTEKLDKWLVRRLVEDYPFLGNEAEFGATAVREIVDQHRVLPVLDGLDEMPEEQRPIALRAIHADWSASWPLVLTCRAKEFDATSWDAPVEVLVVRLLPLEAQVVADHLRETAAGSRLESWEPVLADLVEHPSGPLACALTTPLMLFLARTVYEEADLSPRELVDGRRFARKEDVEKHLLDRFVPTVFRTRPPRDVPSPTRPTRQWDPAVAERTLAFLATQLRERGTHDLAWWQLQRAVPWLVDHVVRVLVGTLSCGLLGWILFGLFGRPYLGVAFGLLVGFLAAVPLGGLHEKKPRRFAPRALRRSELTREFVIRDIGFGVVGALVGGLIVGLLYHVGYGMAIGLFFGLIFGIVRRFTEPTEPKEAVSPASVLRSDRGTVFYAALLGGTAGALTGGFLGGVLGAQEHGLIFDLSPAQEGALGAAVGLLLGAAGLAMMVYATSAWARFVLARIWFACHGWTSLRLMTFLQDAHKLGVLRQVGAHYQFRHALLQERLAQGAATTPPATAGTVPAAPPAHRG